MKTDLLLTIKNLSFGYGDNLIFQNLDLEIEEGKFIAVFGGNGSGKTTLLNLIGGFNRPNSGELFFGNLRPEATPLARLKNGIRNIQQIPSLFPHLSVSDNIKIFNSPFQKEINEKELIGLITKVFEDFEVSISLDSLVLNLDESQKQFLEFTKSFIGDPRLILIDETTSALDLPLSQRIIDFLRSFCDRGGSVIFVTHRISELKEKIDDTYKIANKRLEKVSSIRKTNTKIDRRVKSHNDSKEILSLANHPSIVLKSHMAIGVTGLSGSGYEHFGESTFQRLLKKEKLKIAEDFAYLSRSRNEDLIFSGKSIRFNLSPRVNPDDQTLKEVIRNIGVIPSDPDFIADDLSGGNKMKVAIGRILSMKPRVIILDEPYTGLDTSTREIMNQIIIEMVENGVSAIIISREYEELLKCCSKVLVVKKKSELVTISNTSSSPAQVADLEEELYKKML